MYKIAVIGAGQLGSRYVQGFLSSNMKVSIEVVDTSILSLQACQERIKEISYDALDKEIKFLENIHDISNALDIVVVSTTSNVRANIVREVLQYKKVKNLILEKVLFQRLEDYYSILELLNKLEVNCWVNHNRRMLPFYQKLKEETKGSSCIAMSVLGGNWGMGCNALHFLDLFEFLSNEKIQQIDCESLHKEIIESKRKGFKEFNGMMHGKNNKGEFSLISTNKTSPMLLNIVYDECSLIIDEGRGWYQKKIRDDRQGEIIIEENVKIAYFQSELSIPLLQEVLDDKCKLPTYEEAMLLHVKFIVSLMKHIISIEGAHFDYCPIT